MRAGKYENCLFGNNGDKMVVEIAVNIVRTNKTGKAISH